MVSNNIPTSLINIFDHIIEFLKAFFLLNQATDDLMHCEITISVMTDPFLTAESGSADSALCELFKVISNQLHLKVSSQ